MAWAAAMGRRRRLPATLVVVAVWLGVALLAPLRQHPARDERTPAAPGRAALRRLLEESTSSTTAEVTEAAEALPKATEALLEAEEFSASAEGSGDDYAYDDGPERNCTARAVDEFPDDLLTARERRRGGALLHAFVAAYLFVFLAVVCDEYFVPSIKQLCARLELPEDVAGATFMAAATSSPELFINCVGTFITEGDIGVGTVVGSGVFNILVVPACCGLFGGRVVRLNPWPLTRDSAAYAATILLLIAALSDGRVEWFEAAAFVVLYFVYVGALCAGRRCCGCLRRVCLGDDGDADAAAAADERRDAAAAAALSAAALEDGRRGDGGDVWSGAGERKPLLPRVAGDTGKSRGWHYQFTSGNSKLVIQDIEEFSDEGVCSPPPGAGFCVFCWWLLLRPIKALLHLTVPDCRRPRWRPLYPLTFFMCMLWIAAASYVVAWMITIVGDTLQIPDSVMGLTLLAAGTSLPEAVSSVIVTNQGYGAMGISNSIGSNTFNILLCLGLPWLLKSVFFPPAPDQFWVNINSGGLLYNTISLLTTLFLLYTAFAYNSFKLDRKVGFVTLIMYLGFIAIAFAVELNVFGVVNLPTCPH